MVGSSTHDAWGLGRSYDEYMGRWSLRIADVFLERLAAPPQLRWVDVGCGTGALTSRIVASCAPSTVLGVEPSPDFVARAMEAVVDPAVRFAIGSADSLPVDDADADLVVSALAYNFFPDRQAALAEFQRIAAPGATIALYVWDYPSGGVEFIDRFWKRAAAQDAGARELDEAARFPFCNPDTLRDEFEAAGLDGVEVRPIEVPTPFPDIEAFWAPFLLGAGPAPGYVASLTDDHRGRLKAALADDLRGRTRDLTARAWSISSTRR